MTIPDILAAAKMMKALKSEYVIPGHGKPGTVKIFEETEKYDALLLETCLVRWSKPASRRARFSEGIVKTPEYAQWASQERILGTVRSSLKVGAGKSNR